jgi:ribosome modulation factor
MKRHKRDMSERAFQKGYLAGLNGKSKDACPTEQNTLHQQWVNGWRGRPDRQLGREIRR